MTRTPPTTAELADCLTFRCNLSTLRALDEAFAELDAETEDAMYADILTNAEVESC